MFLPGIAAPGFCELDLRCGTHLFLPELGDSESLVSPGWGPLASSHLVSSEVGLSVVGTKKLEQSPREPRPREAPPPGSPAPREPRPQGAPPKDVPPPGSTPPQTQHPPSWLQSANVSMLTAPSRTSVFKRTLVHILPCRWAGGRPGSSRQVQDPRVCRPPGGRDPALRDTRLGDMSARVATFLRGSVSNTALMWRMDPQTQLNLTTCTLPRRGWRPCRARTAASAATQLHGIRGAAVRSGICCFQTVT